MGEVRRGERRQSGRGEKEHRRQERRGKRVVVGVGETQEREREKERLFGVGNTVEAVFFAKC